MDTPLNQALIQSKTREIEALQRRICHLAGVHYDTPEDEQAIINMLADQTVLIRQREMLAKVAQ